MRKFIGRATVLAGALVVGGLLGATPRARATSASVTAPASIDQLDWIHRVQQQGEAPKVDTSARHRKIIVRDDTRQRPRSRP